jgi:hypothetical protein
MALIVGPVDGFDCGTEALPGGYGRVAVVVLHPEPHGLLEHMHPEPHDLLERDGGVLPHLLWVVQPIEANVLPRRSIIVIPAFINNLRVCQETCLFLLAVNKFQN